MSWAIVAGAVVTGGIGAVVANNTKPKPADPGETAGEVLDAKLQYAPDIFAAESSNAYGRPAYQDLQLRLLNEALYGKGAEQLNLTDLGKKLAGDMAEQNRIAQTTQRQNELADVENLGGRYLDAINQANPELTALRSKIGQAGMDALDRQYDTEMTAEDMRNATQGARQGYADRGMFRSNPSVAAEVLQTDRYRRYLEDRAFAQQQQDRNFALGAGQFTAATSTDPLQAVLGRPGHNIANNAQALAQAGSTTTGGPQYYDPFGAGYSQYAGQVYDSGVQNQDFYGGLFGGIVGGLGQIGGSYFGG